MSRVKSFIESLETFNYRGFHLAPVKDESNAPLYDLTQIYPEDVYTRPYSYLFGGVFNDTHDMIRTIKKVRNNPEAIVTIYRVVPSNVKNPKMYPGDWVSLSKDYVVSHGERTLNGKYTLLFKMVKAKDVFSEANSLYEYGYGPEEHESD